MRVLITGGAGFIGGNLCRRLLASDQVSSVVVLDDLSSGLLSNIEGLPVEFEEGSVLDESLLKQLTPGVDAVVHLAARGSVPRSVEDPIGAMRINTFGTLSVLEACRAAGTAHLIFASSSSVYGMNPIMPKSEDLATLPASPYAASKLGAEALVLAYGATYGMANLAFRFFNVYGPLQPADHAYAAVIPRFVDAALDGRPVHVYGDGKQSRDFTYVDTLTAILLRALTTRTTSPGAVNLAFGGRTSLIDLIDLIEVEIGRPIEREHLPTRQSDVPHSQASCDKLVELFPGASSVEIRDGLRATINWHRELRRTSKADTCAVSQA